MAENKAKPTRRSVKAFIDRVPNATRRADARTVLALMQKVSGVAPQMWGPSIIGFGSVRYRYDSGREGIMPRIGFSPRGATLVVYILGGPRTEALLKRLGKHKFGVSCLYINRLADVDMGVLETLVRNDWKHARPR
jgi:hypothetical protein